MPRSPLARALASLAALTACGYAVGRIAGFRERAFVPEWDAAGVGAATRWAARGAEGYLRAATWMADTSTVLAVLGALGLAALLLRRARVFWFPALASAGGGVLSTSIKLLVGRPRPGGVAQLVHATGFAFPSGHALQSIALYGSLALVGATLVDPRLGRPVRAALLVLAAVIALAVGVSRVGLGVHYPSDVLAGWTLGGLWLWSAALALSPDAATRRVETW